MTNELECPVCSSQKIRTFHEQKNIPVYCNVLLANKEEALAAPRGDIKLGLCLQCGHVYNISFDPSLLAYTTEYENSLHFSGFFQKYADDLAAHLVERFQLHDKDLVEIGCGKGDFLAQLCRLGKNRGTGFDKSYNDDQETFPGLRFIRDFYSPRYSDTKVDFLYSRHVLEHIDKPQPFLEGLREAMAEKGAVDIFFEVPNLLYSLKSMGIWDIIYEHCGYYSSSSLGYLFSNHGFVVEEIAESFQTQFLTLYGKLGVGSGNPYNTGEQLKELEQLASDFYDNYREKTTRWQKELDDLAPGKAVIWGAGSKGVTFLNTLHTMDKIFHAVDINPRKRHKFIPGTGQPVVVPEELTKIQPEVVFVMNPNYRMEIQTQLDSLGLKCKLICV